MRDRKKVPQARTLPGSVLDLPPANDLLGMFPSYQRPAETQFSLRARPVREPCGGVYISWARTAWRRPESIGKRRKLDPNSVSESALTIQCDLPSIISASHN